MHFILVGINFKTADVEIREKLHFSFEELPIALDLLKCQPSIKGCVILSTCNRVEIYASVDNIHNGFNDITNFLSNYHSLPVNKIVDSLYKKHCKEANNHLFRVVSSLDSMVIGEYQIQGQVKAAYFKAQECKVTNNVVNKVFQTAIQIGKKVRSETKIGEGSVSVATLAVEIVKQVVEKKNNLNVLLIGAGKMSTLTAANFQEQFEKPNISVTNRSQENAIEFAQKFKANVVEFEKRNDSICESDIIIASTSAENYVVCKDDVLNLKTLDKKRIFIDLSIPRNIDPEISFIDNCIVYSIDDINKLITSNLEKRSTEITKVEKIISEISEDYYAWYSRQFGALNTSEIITEFESELLIA